MAGKEALTRNMVAQAYLLASIDIFHVSAWLCLLAVVIVWFCHRTRRAAPPALSD
jgi:DHA2 family multidrug resistance protein